MTERTCSPYVRRGGFVQETEIGECLYWTEVDLDENGDGCFDIHVRDPYVHNSLGGIMTDGDTRGVFVAPSNVIINEATRGHLVLTYKGMPLLAVHGEEKSPHRVPISFSPIPGTRARIPVERGAVGGTIEGGEPHTKLTIEVRCIVFERK